MMHVFFNGLQANNRSGTGRYAIELLRALYGMDDAPSIIAALPGREAAALPAKSGFQTLSGAGTPLGRMLFERFRMAALAEERNAAVAHFPANFCPNRFRVPIVLTVHDLSFLRHPEWFPANRAAYYRAAARRSVKVACRILADSQATARDLETLLDVSPDRIDVVPLGVGPEFRPADAETVAAVRHQHRLPERFFLYVGTHEPRKNLARLVEAWSQTAGDLPQHLVLVGRHGWKNKELDAAIAASPHAKRIHRPGHLSHAELPAVLSAADAFVFPSLFEGFGLPPLEAMACGTPVLSSDTSSLPEVTGDAAILVDPHSVDAIATGLHRVIDEADTLRERGLRRAAEFTWERCARATVACYRTASGL